MNQSFKVSVARSVSCLAVFTACMSAGAQTCDLNKTIAEMDAGSAKFQSVQADFTWDQLTAVVQEHDVQSGEVYFQKHGGTTIMAADIQKPAAKQIVFDSNNLTMYTPGTNQELIYSVAKNKEEAEGFLTLGFGGSGTDLKRTWDVTCAGMETIAGTPTAKLVLIPKLDSVKANFSKVTIWVDPVRDISLKQILEQPQSGDTRTNTFTNIKYNGPISASVFKIKTAANPSITRK
jgi:outer membrane lipoprotein-sorting protein